MSDSLFQVTGVASGIGWDEIIEKTITAAKKPATIWQNKIDTLEYKRTLYQEISSSLFKLRNTLTPLKLESTYKKKAAEFAVRSPVGGDAASILKATVKPEAEIAQWNINVKQLAQEQRHISKRFSDNAGDPLGIQGSFRIHVGIQTAVVDIEATDSIRDINLKIQRLKDQEGNAFAVTAKLIDNRLVIESALTGQANSGPLKEGGLTFTKTFETLTDIRNNTVSDADFADPGVADTDKYKAGYKTYLARSASGSYPPQVFRLVEKGANDNVTKTYVSGRDYTYNADDGSITWLVDNDSTLPTEGTAVYAIFSEDMNISRGNLNSSSLTGTGTATDGTGAAVTINPADFQSDYEMMPLLPSGETFNIEDNGAFTIYSTDMKKKYVCGVDFDVLDYQEGGTTCQLIRWNIPEADRPTAGSTYVLRSGANTSYSVNEHQFYIEEDGIDPDVPEGSVLYQLGFLSTEEDTATPGHMLWKYENFQEAQDAVLTVNGVEIRRTVNEIEDIIANVKLELVGTGELTMNITQDATKAIESMEAFIEAYNEMMELINYRLEEKYNSNTIDEDDDYLQSILKESRGSTTFGALHGDQLLWSIKNQFRRNVSNPISSLSTSLRSKKFLHTDTALTMQGSFYLYVGGKATRIDIANNDSLEDIQRKLEQATSTNNKTRDASASGGADMGLDVSIVDGQLIINTPSGTKNTETISGSYNRDTAQSYDLLDNVPITTSPVNGTLTVYAGSTTYTEGVDYRLSTVENDKGVLESRIEWLSSGKSPSPGTEFKTYYEYNPSAVAFKSIDGSGSLSGLDLHFDSSSIQLSTLGITTESTNYGKSGLLEFDSEKFFEAIKDDSQMVSNVMLTFMKGVDAYIGNLVDSSNILVGGTAVTKGRIAAALNNIDTEVSTLSEQIAKLEKQLEERQKNMYKQYSSMEQAIQKMNAQMSSMSQFFSNNSSS